VSHESSTGERPGFFDLHSCGALWCRSRGRNCCRLLVMESRGACGRWMSRMRSFTSLEVTAGPMRSSTLTACAHALRASTLLCVRS